LLVTDNLELKMGLVLLALLGQTTMYRSPQVKTDGEHDPDGDGPASLFSRFKSPLFDGSKSRPIELLVPGAALDQDVLDPPPLTDMHFEQGRTFNTSPSGRFRIVRLDLIAS
jgi:hypothetical protein